jgi:hypothetical protein
MQLFVKSLKSIEFCIGFAEATAADAPHTIARQEQGKDGIVKQT